MKTSVIGFPRIGKDRELKFASEKYFGGAIDAAGLEATARAVRAYGWKTAQHAGIDFIPSGDFSFYDNMLDTAVMLGVIPERYAALNLSPLDTYFAMARGYQGSAGDVKALALKKWFNTNYHYLVPEIEDSAVVHPVAAPLAAAYAESLALGIETVPSIIGPYTFLRFARFTGKKCAVDVADAISNAYVGILTALAGQGAGWMAFVEPALVLDMTSDDTAFFTSLYAPLLEKATACGMRPILQTYFGDIRNSYKTVCDLGFAGIGLDFVEGKQTRALVHEHGFPDDALLFAGIISGKNIWRADYAKTGAVISEIARVVPSDRIVVSPSCSLLHVPYTTAGETTLPPDVVRHFAFAEEKLTELTELAAIAQETESGRGALARNKDLFAAPRVAPNESVRRQCAALTDRDMTRQPEFAEREAIQKAALHLPLFPTTTIGSFPQIREVRSARALVKKGGMSSAEYESFIREKIAACISLQESIGLDVLVHGEYERNDMVEYFGNCLDGFVFTDNAWVQSYGTRCVKPPVLWGDVSRREPITVPWSVFAQSCTQRPVKGMLTGPVTILNWSFPREDISLREQAFQIGLAIRGEVLDLEQNGIRIIQIDEAALREKLPLRKADWHADYLDWAIKAFRLVHAGVRPETQIHTHMCYSEFNDIIADIDSMDADVITFEASRSDLTILDALSAAHFRTEVGPGVYDIHSPRVPSVKEMVGALEKMVTKIPAEKLWVNPDCGLKTRGEAETKESLANLVRAAHEIRAAHAVDIP
ncbi:MAG: 5-methyltetrahydropteroyltriglutamate--homocysteine S-methyltransferase [Treponema sp.]|nr:5-methyltetrahydropteroyltriglutamate--homocysteine S-methyltransferase [Treponema sp.]